MSFNGTFTQIKKLCELSQGFFCCRFFNFALYSVLYLYTRKKTLGMTNGIPKNIFCRTLS